jgi:hypothetical protein
LWDSDRIELKASALRNNFLKQMPCKKEGDSSLVWFPGTRIANWTVIKALQPGSLPLKGP